MVRLVVEPHSGCERQQDDAEIVRAIAERRPLEESPTWWITGHPSRACLDLRVHAGWPASAMLLRGEACFP